MGRADERQQPSHDHMIYSPGDNVRQVLESQEQELGYVLDVPLRVIGKERTGR